MKRIGSFIAGLLVGTMLFGGSVAYAAGVAAELSSHRFFVDGQEVKMTAYAINGNNYVMLRDIGKAVGFNVHWDSTNGCVQIESDKPYTGTAPAKTQSVAVGAKKADYTQADVMPEPKAGDKIPCSDGYVYEITDVSKYQNSMFATQETDTLPDPTCDWSLLDQPTLPEPEANHFASGGKEYMFVRNLFETRRMQYTLYNAIGDQSADLAERKARNQSGWQPSCDREAVYSRKRGSQQLLALAFRPDRRTFQFLPSRRVRL